MVCFDWVAFRFDFVGFLSMDVLELIMDVLELHKLFHSPQVFTGIDQVLTRKKSYLMQQ